MGKRFVKQLGQFIVTLFGITFFNIYTSIYSLCLKNYIYKGIFRGLYIKLTIITNRYFLLV